MALVTRALVAAAVLTLFGLFLSVEANGVSLVPASCADKSNTSCGQCLQNVSCLWCGKNQKCIDYPVRFYIVPASTICPWDWARWGVCWINLQNLIIVFSLVAGIVCFAILLLICCCCCCRCQKRGGNKKQSARMERHTRMGNIGAQT